MARVRSTTLAGSQAPSRGLIDEIFKALRGEEQADGPVIFEVSQGETGYVQVIVVWERWADLSADLRNRIVMDGYRELGKEHPDEVTVDKISLVLPVTADQAIEMGILPYSVRCSVHRTHHNYDRIQPLLKQQGAIGSGAGAELRLPTLQMAREARDRLQAATSDIEPEVHWQISEQVGRIFEY